MIAPSEKHLEDWIVGNLSAFHSFMNPLARQLRLPSGVLDLLTVADRQNRIYVVELKQEAIDTKTVVQALRYMNDLQGIYENLVGKMMLSKTIDWVEFDYSFDRAAHHIQGVVVGHRVKSNDVLYACEAAGITVMTYEFENDTYTFQTVTSPSVKTLYKEQEKFVRPEIEVAIKEMILQEINRARSTGQLQDWPDDEQPG